MIPPEMLIKFAISALYFLTADEIKIEINAIIAIFTIILHLKLSILTNFTIKRKTNKAQRVFLLSQKVHLPLIEQ